MNNKDILYKAILKAEKNGYNKESGLSLVHLTRNAVQPKNKGDVTGISLDLEYLELNVFIPFIIFDHKFAKAFWGKDEICFYCNGDSKDWIKGTCPECFCNPKYRSK